MQNNELLVNAFQVEELEERLEMGEWTLEAETEIKNEPGTGTTTTTTVGVQYRF